MTAKHHFSVQSLRAIEADIQAIINRMSRCNTGDPEQIYLDSADVIALLRVNARILKYWRKKGRLPCTRIRGRPYYKLAAVHRLLEEAAQ